MFEKRRCHITHIFEMFARQVYLLCAMVITFGLSIIGDLASDEELKADLRRMVGSTVSVRWLVVMAAAALALGAALLLLFYCALQWRFTFVSVQENTLLYESGILLKKRVAIPFEKINTIDMGRNLFERLVGTCRLKVDTGAYSNRDERKQAEMNLVFGLAEAEEIRAYILNRAQMDADADAAQNGIASIADREPNWVIRAGMWDFLLYGLTSSSVWRIFWIAVLGVCFVAELSAGLVEYAVDAVMPFATTAMEAMTGYSTISLLLLFVMVWLVMSLISNLFTVLMAVLRFYGFRVAREGRNVIVRYGLITVKNYTLQVRNIHAVIVKQNLFQQMLGRCSVEAVCMGFGDEQNETALLFPIIQKRKLNELLGVMLPEYVTETDVRPRKKSGFLFHAVTPALFWAAVGGLVCLLCSFLMDTVLLPAVITGIVTVMRFVSGILSYGNTTLDWNQRVVSVQSGGFRKTTYRIRTDAVQEVQLVTDVLRRPLGIGTYRVHYHGPTLNNTAVVNDISSRYFAELADTVED